MTATLTPASGQPRPPPGPSPPLHLALSTLTPAQRRALTAAVPALDALARAVDRLADAPVPPAGQGGG